LRIVCLAYQLIGHAALRYFLEESGDEVVALITHRDSPGEEVWWPSAAELATEHGVPVFSPEDINAPASAQLLAHLSPDFLLSAWYRQLLKQPALGVARRGALNLHGSLLPRYRGRAPVNWVLVNGETETGMTLHDMVPRADAGDIVGQMRVPVTDDDTALSLYHKLAEATVEVLRSTWPAVASGEAPRIAQDESEATYVGRRTPRDGLFRWDWPARRIHNLVRAVTHPYPGAFCEGRRGAVLVWAAEPIEAPAAAAPGTVTSLASDGLVVATGSGSLRVLSAQVVGDEELDGAAFARRYGLRPGAAF